MEDIQESREGNKPANQAPAKKSNKNVDNQLIQKYIKQITKLKTKNTENERQIQALLKEKEDSEQLQDILEKLVDKFKASFDQNQKEKRALEKKL